MSISVLFNDNPDEAIYLPQPIGDIVKEICQYSIRDSVKDSANAYVQKNTTNCNVKGRLSMDMNYYASHGIKLKKYDACELYSMIDNSELFNNYYNKRIIKHNGSQ